MLQPRHTAGHRPPDCLAILACLVALLVAFPVFAVAPPVAQKDIQGPPLFEPAADENRFHTDPVLMTAQVIGASSTPQVGRFAALAIVFGGEHPRVKSWSLDNPLTNRYNRINLGASTLFLNGLQGGGAPLGGLTAIATLEAGKYFECWPLADTDRFRPLPHAWNKAISDGPLAGAGSVEAGIYSAILVRALYTSDKAFQSAVRRDVTLPHLLEDPEVYRGEVVRIEGRLQKINRYKPPFEAEEGGVNDLYEAWIAVNAQPVCVLFPAWPKGLSRSYLGKAKIDDAPLVSFDGYFFKLWKGFQFKLNNRDVVKDVPLVIGHTLRVVPPAVPPQLADGWAKLVVVVVVTLFGGLLVGVIGVTYWMRRSDNELRKRLLAKRSPDFILPPPDAMPVAQVAPVAKGETTTPRFRFPRSPGGRPDSGPPGKGGDRGSTEYDPDEDAGA